MVNFTDFANFVGIFRNVMPHSLKTRQPVIGLDVFGRTNVQDLTLNAGKVGDALNLALTVFKKPDDNTKIKLQLIPCLNSEFKGQKPHSIIRTDDIRGRCIGTNVAGYVHIGTVIHTPMRRKLKNRQTAWRFSDQASAMNHVEIILA